MNNVPIVVLLLPILVSVSLRNNRLASQILMPMGFATWLGHELMIGTSTNLLVVSVASDMGLARFQHVRFLYSGGHCRWGRDSFLVAGGTPYVTSTRDLDGDTSRAFLRRN